MRLRISGGRQKQPDPLQRLYPVGVVAGPGEEEILAELYQSLVIPATCASEV
jgi:hypothetical protein